MLTTAVCCARLPSRLRARTRPFSTAVTLLPAMAMPVLRRRVGATISVSSPVATSTLLRAVRRRWRRSMVFWRNTTRLPSALIVTSWPLPLVVISWVAPSAMLTFVSASVPASEITTKEPSGLIVGMLATMFCGRFTSFTEATSTSCAWAAIAASANAAEKRVFLIAIGLR